MSQNQDAGSRHLMSQTVYSHPDRQVKQAESLHGPNAVNKEEPGVNAENPSKSTDPNAPVHDWEKRYRDLQSYSQKQVNTLTAEVGRLTSQSPVSLRMPKTPEELEAFRTENPENFAIIESIAHGIAEKQMQTMTGELDSVRTEMAQKTQDQAMVALTTAHPDFAEIDASPLFHEWLRKQNDEVQSWIFTGQDYGHIEMALSLFKANTGYGSGNTATQQRPNEPSANQQLDESRSVGEGGGGEPTGSDPRLSLSYIWHESEIASLRGEAYIAYSDAIDTAQDQGRILRG